MSKRTIFFSAAALLCAVAVAAPARRTTGAAASRGASRAAAGDEGPGASAGKVRVAVEQYPKLGRAATAAAPSIGESALGPAWNGKPRRWIVLESKYQTFDKCIDRLTFTWHVLLETKSATAADRKGQAAIAPYSYLSQTVTYANIPRGTHAASVCAHPSFLEQYGEPKAVGLVISDSNGEVVVGDSFSEIQGIKAHTKWWDDASIMDAKQGDKPMIERRMGLQDRSKTIWAIVNPNDYEMVVQ